MEAIHYKDLIKKVHPDLNPNVHDAGTKVSQIMANKNNPSELMRLAIQWGLIKGEAPKPKDNPYDWAIFAYHNHKYFKPGMRVKFSTSNGETYAWFVKSGRGRVFFTDKKGVFTINKSLKDLYNRFYILKKRNEDLSYNEKMEWSEIVKDLGKKKPTKKNTSNNSSNVNHDDLFSNLDLEPNRNYYGDRYMKYKNNYYRLWKTNDKCAFIIIDGVMKKVQLKSLEKGWMR
ncbi:MAG: hypothetical protein RBS24_06980 [Bacilli bacterium]|nr:hypothetical protein [Bacilli bacterium]